MFDEDLEEVPGATAAAEAEMLRTRGPATIVLVEGGSDERFLSKFVDLGHCEIVIAQCRANALGALEILRSRRLSGVLCIIDRDYDDVLNVVRNDPEIVLTDERDLDSLLFFSPALDRILLEIASRPKVGALMAKGSNARAIVVDAATELGKFRAASHKTGASLKFKGIKYDFIDRKTLSISRKKMIETVLSNTTSREAGAIDWNEQIDKFDGSGLSNSVCCGHDLTRILGKALQSLIGNLSGRQSTREAVESQLRLSYGVDDFRLTQMCREIKNWELRSAPFVVLRPGI